MRELAKKTFIFLKSVKLGIALLIYLIITSILSTLIPLNQATVFYFQNYISFLAWLITITEFNRFFESPAFIIPG